MRPRIKTVTVNGRLKAVMNKYEYRFGEWVAVPVANVWSADPTPCRTITKIGTERRQHFNELKQYAAECHPELYGKLFQGGAKKACSAV